MSADHFQTNLSAAPVYVSATGARAQVPLGVFQAPMAWGVQPDPRAVHSHPFGGVPVAPFHVAEDTSRGSNRSLRQEGLTPPFVNRAAPMNGVRQDVAHVMPLKMVDESASGKTAWRTKAQQSPMLHCLPAEMNSNSTWSSTSRRQGWGSTPPLSPEKASLGSPPLSAIHPSGYTGSSRSGRGGGVPQVVPVRAARGRIPSFGSSHSSLRSADSCDTSPSRKATGFQNNRAQKPQGVFSNDSDSSRSHCSRTSHASGARSKQQPSVPASPEHRHRQRKKQILFGKVTDGYRNYRYLVPTSDRQPSNPSHPMTPNALEECSKRRWDAAVGAWRRALHLWDNPPDASEFRLENAPTLADLNLVPAEPHEAYMERTTRELETLRNEVNRWSLKGSNASDATSNGSARTHPSAMPISESSRTDHSARDTAFNISGTSGVIGQSLDENSGRSTPHAVRNFDPLNYLPEGGLSAAHSRTTDDADDGSRSEADDRIAAFRSWQKPLDLAAYDSHGEPSEVAHAHPMSASSPAPRLSEGSVMSSAQMFNDRLLSRPPFAWVAGSQKSVVPRFSLWVQIDDEDTLGAIPRPPPSDEHQYEMPLVSVNSADSTAPVDAEGAVDVVNAFMRMLNFRFDLRSLFWCSRGDEQRRDGVEIFLQPLAATVEDFETKVSRSIVDAVRARKDSARPLWRDLDVALPHLVYCGPSPHPLEEVDRNSMSSDPADFHLLPNLDESTEIANLVREGAATVQFGGDALASRGRLQDGKSPEFTVNPSLLLRASSSSSSADGNRPDGAQHFGSAALLNDCTSWSPVGNEN